MIADLLNLIVYIIMIIIAVVLYLEENGKFKYKS